MESFFGDNHDDVHQQEIWEILAALQPTEPLEVERNSQKRERDIDPETLLFGDFGEIDVDVDNLPEFPSCEVPKMTKTSENSEFILRVPTLKIGLEYLEQLKVLFDHVCKKKKWIPSKTKATKKKGQEPQAVSIKGGQMYINVEGKPSVRIFPSKISGCGKMTIQGPTREVIVERASEIARMLNRKWTGCETEFAGCLTAMFSGEFVDKHGVVIKGLKLTEFNEILRDKLKEHNSTSFFNPEKDNCITILLIGQDDIKHGEEEKQGQLRLFSTGKATGFGVKSFKTLHHFWTIVTHTLWDNFGKVTTDVAVKKQKTGASRNSPKCSACGNIGHNKRTCPNKK